MTKIQTYTGEFLEATLEELLAEIASSIKSVYPQAQVILFGSYARGDYTKDSDLDICILVPELTHSRAEMEISAACTIRRGFPLPIDFTLYTYDEFKEKSMNRFLVQHEIKKEGVVLGE